MTEHQHRVLVVIATLWLVLTPFLRAQFVAIAIVCPVAVVLPRYIPEIAFGFAFLLLLPAVWRRKAWVSTVLVASAIALPFVAFGVGRTWLWIVSSILLLIVAYSARMLAPSSAFQARRGYMRALMAVTHGLMFIATPGAYLQLTGGAVAAVAGFREGHALLAGLLLGFSIIGLHGLWSVWSVSARLWNYGAYVLPHGRQRRRDIRGLVAASVALLGFAAIARPIFRMPEVVALSVALGPALVLTSVVVLLSQARTLDEPRQFPMSVGAAPNEIAALLGMVCGVAAALLGIAYLIPAAPSGWGPCAWPILFPIEGYLWPTERPYIADACATGLPYQATMFGVASVVFWMAGIITTAVGRTVQAPLAALAAALAATAALVWATLLRVHVDWLSTIGVGLAIVFWAARLGYLGGLRGARFATPKQPRLRGAVAASTDGMHPHARMPGEPSGGWMRSLTRPAAILVQCVAACTLVLVIFIHVRERQPRIPATREEAAGAILSVKYEGDVALLSAHLIDQAFLEFCGEPALAETARPWAIVAASVRNAALDNPLLKRFGFETTAVEASMEGAEQAFRLGVLQGLLENGAQLPAEEKEKICENAQRRFRDTEFVRVHHVGESPSPITAATTANAVYDGIRSSMEQQVRQLSPSLGPKIRSAALANVCKHEDSWLLKAKYLGELPMDEYRASFLSSLSNDIAADEALMSAAFRASLDRHYDGYLRAVAALNHQAEASFAATMCGA
jgi:hypothetical protein